MKTYLFHLFRRIPNSVFIAIGVAILCTYLVSRAKIYNRESYSLIQRVSEINSLLSSSNKWESRHNWINSKIPKFDSHKMAADSLSYHVGKSLSKHDLRFDLVYSREIPSMIHTGFEQASIDLVVKGEERNIIEWIHHIQQPANFIGIDQFTLEAGKYGLICAMQVTQWYSGGERSIDPGQHHETEIHDSVSDLANRF